jgi:hypothetical protein
MSWTDFETTFQKDFAKVRSTAQRIHELSAYTTALLLDLVLSQPCLHSIQNSLPCFACLQDLAKLFPGPATARLLAQLKLSLFQGADSIDMARYQLWYKRYDLMMKLPFWNVVQVRRVVPGS